MFQPYRAIGFVSDATPFDVFKLGTENFVTVAVGKSFQVYNVGSYRMKSFTIILKIYCFDSVTSFAL